jgi:hypothetical protein
MAKTSKHHSSGFFFVIYSSKSFRNYPEVSLPSIGIAWPVIQEASLDAKLETSISIPPRISSTSENAFFTSSGLPTSLQALPLNFGFSAVVLSRAFLSQSTIKILAHSDINLFAVARPIPLAALVITTLLPSRSL